MRAESPSGFRRLVQTYLSDLIYGANDGIVTTLAIVSGVVGANLPATAILTLGFANLVADGFSMGASNYLSRRTEVRKSDRPSRPDAARRGSATFLGFVVAGMMPLIAYLVPGLTTDWFVIAVALALATLFLVGAGRAFFTDLWWFRAGLEMLFVGALAAGVAFGIGSLGAMVTDGGEPESGAAATAPAQTVAARAGAAGAPERAADPRTDRVTGGRRRPPSPGRQAHSPFSSGSIGCFDRSSRRSLNTSAFETSSSLASRSTPSSFFTSAAAAIRI